jgi:hypothetical protein
MTVLTAFLTQKWDNIDDKSPVLAQKADRAKVELENQ